MRLKRSLALLGLFSFVTLSSLAQPRSDYAGNASKCDWEEINFEFNSDLLIDGFPSLIRLGELMRKNPEYRLSITGHADFIGGNRYNEGLGERRANAVRRFLEGMGVSAGQIRVETRGETEPKVQSRRRSFARTDEARWVNRRVFLSLQDASGKVIGDSDACNQPEILDCCKEIMSRLDKMHGAWDPILQGLADRFKSLMDAHNQLMDEHKKLLAEHGVRRQEHEGLKTDIGQRPTNQQVTDIVEERVATLRIPRFNIINANAGLDQDGSLTFTGRGRLFIPFRERNAVQMQGEYMYFRDRQEAQGDFGVVNRFARSVQAGFFGSFKHVSFNQQSVPRDPFAGTTISALDRPGIRQFDPGEIPTGSGTLGQASLTLDMLFEGGRVGIFGAKGFLNNAVIGRTALTNNIFDEYYLRTIDQVGLSALFGLVGDSYVEGNLAYLKSRGNADRLGGTARFVFPLSERFAFTLEGGMNETLVSAGNNGRVVAGFQMGNFQRPKDFMTEVNGMLHAVPADIPRVRFEVLTRRTRTGNDGPVADAGPDQVGVEAGQITLNGSGSFDPDGDPITFQWSQIAGPSVSISGMNSAVATFTAAEGQTYSFRLTVRDDKGAQGIARTTVTTTQQEQVQILRFQASPTNIRAGQSSTIDWQVLNADTVTIEGIGNVDPGNGTRTVTPTRTTQYRLTARNRVSQATATTTIVVEEEPPAQILACQVTPMNITAGESATIFYSTQNADEVTISGIGSVANSGTQVVTPTQTTTFVLTARNERGPVTCSLTVQVMARVEVPRVISFTANPTSIQRGNASTLSWNVENAQTVSIATVGTVQSTGTTDVRPTQTTTYVLTATNASGSVTASTTVTVTEPPGPQPGVDPTITACTASPATSPRPGDPVVLRYTAANAARVTINGANASVAGPTTVNPTTNTTFTIIAFGADAARTATCTVAVTVTPPTPPVAIITGPSVVETISRQLVLDASESTNPAGGALTYTWEPLSTGAAVLDQGQVRTRVQLGGLSGDYIFRLTVRNALGQSDSTTVTVRFRSTTVP